MEITAHFLDRIHSHNSTLNAFLTIEEDSAKEQAVISERAVMSGKELGPLHGVPIAIKDLSATKGIRTTYGSSIYANYVPTYDDIPVKRIREAGAIIVGKTNTSDFGWKATTENLLGGPCRNPWDPDNTAGGSSGGSGSALAAGLVPIATGGDAGGSIRIPASFCGVYGIKPTFGRVPAAYNRPGGWRPLSQNGPLSNNVRDSALLLQIMSGQDSTDATSFEDHQSDFVADTTPDSLKGFRIAWSPNLDGRPVDSEVRELTLSAALAFQELGASVDEATPELVTNDLKEIFKTFILTDLLINLEPYLASEQVKLLPKGLRQLLDEAQTWPATRYSLHLRELEWHKARLAHFFSQYDLLLLPTMAVPSFPINQAPDMIDGVPVEPFWGFAPFCFPFNLSGHPAASIPCGFTKKELPVGLQIVGGMGNEKAIFKASAAFENARPWNHHRPEISY